MPSRQIGAVAFIIAIVGFPLTLPAHPATRNEAASAAVTATLQRSASAFARGDLAAASSVWSNDEMLTVFEGGHVNRGWRDYRDNHLGPEMKELRRVSYVLREIQPHLAGNTAWATFRYAISGEDLMGKAFSGDGIGTAVLERRASGWRIVHWHTTGTPKAKPSPEPDSR